MRPARHIIYTGPVNVHGYEVLGKVLKGDLGSRVLPGATLP